MVSGKHQVIAMSITWP